MPKHDPRWMYRTNLRKVGGSVMLAVPKPLLEMLRLEAGSTVGLEIDGERLIVEPKAKPRYTMQELLARCDAEALVSEEERAWIDLPPVGREL